MCVLCPERRHRDLQKQILLQQNRQTGCSNSRCVSSSCKYMMSFKALRVYAKPLMRFLLYCNANNKRIISSIRQRVYMSMSATITHHFYIKNPQISRQMQISYHSLQLSTVIGYNTKYRLNTFQALNGQQCFRGLHSAS